MRGLVTAILLSLSISLSATTYYVSNAGNDSNDGKSEATAWKTIAKVNATTFVSGDKILFRNGDTWRETLTMSSSGAEGAYIKFSTYGTGDKARIYGSNITKWVNYSGNVWVSESTFANPYGGSYPGGVFFEETDGKVTWGFSNVLSGMPAVADLAVNYDWTWISDHIYIYSSSDPNTKYKSVEVAQRDNCIYFNDKNYISFEGLDIRYSKLAGMKEKWPFKGVTFGIEVKNCHVSHIGIKGSKVGYGIEIWHSDTWIHNNEIHDCGRRGLNARTQDADYSVNTLGVASPVVLKNVVFEYNTIYNCYHSLISFVSEEVNGLLKDCTMRYNYCYEDPQQHLNAPEGYYCGHYGFGGHYDGGYNTFENINIHDNVSVGSTAYAFDASGVDHINYYNNTIYGLNPNCGATTVGCFWIQGESHDCKIKNNIFYNNYSSATSDLRPCISFQPDCYLNMEVDYNVYYTTDANQTCWTALGGYGGAYSMSAFEKYKAATGLDAHSIVADPKYVSATDYHLQASSPAIGAGFNVGFLTDIEGNERKNPPSMGAYEYTGAYTPVPQYQSAVIENATPARIDITYSLSLANVVPAASAFTVMVNSTSRTVSSVAVSGTKVQLTLASPAAYGDVVTVAYTKPATNPLQTAEGGQAASLSASKVTNNIGAIAPSFVSAVVENATPARLTMTYNQSLASIVPATTAFTVMVNSSNRTVTAVAVSGTQVALTLASPVVYGDVVTVAYTKPSTNPLQATTGAQASTISASSVTNNVTPVVPVFVSAAVENATPSQVDMTYSIALANVTPDVTAFTVMVNAAQVSVTAVSVTNNKVSLTLAAPVKYGDVVKVSYTRPFANPLQTADGAAAATITLQDVTNNCASTTSKSSSTADISVYPVPAVDYITIAIREDYTETLTLKIYNMAGRTAMTVQLNPAEKTVTIPINLKSGTYLIQVIKSGVTIYSQKLMVKSK